MSEIQQIHDLAEELGIVYYADLSNEIILNYPELMETLLRYPAHFNNWCYSRERMRKRFECNPISKLDENGNPITVLMSSYVSSRNSKLGR